MQTDPSLQRKISSGRTLPLQTPNHRPSLFSKLTLAPATCSYLTTASVTASVSEGRDTKMLMPSTDTFTKKSAASGMSRRTGLVLPSLSLRNRGSKAKPKRSEDKGQPCRIEPFPFTCTTAMGLQYSMLIHQQNSFSNPAVSRTATRKRWYTLPWTDHN